MSQKLDYFYNFHKNRTTRRIDGLAPARAGAKAKQVKKYARPRERRAPTPAPPASAPGQIAVTVADESGRQAAHPVSVRQSADFRSAQWSINIVPLHDAQSYDNKLSLRFKGFNL